MALVMAIVCGLLSSQLMNFTPDLVNNFDNVKDGVFFFFSLRRVAKCGLNGRSVSWLVVPTTFLLFSVV